MWSVKTDQAMGLAVAASRAVLGTTSPNPPVGAVVLDATGSLVGTGATEPPGGTHAEVLALAQAGGRARGGTVVVTLEPCDHLGRTGPCTQALLAAGIARVVYAQDDVAHGGAARLRAAGLQIERTGEMIESLEPWLGAQRLGRPFVTWKCASTLDGRVAAADGSSRWITGESSRADVHRLRAEVDAVLVGVGTVLADDPELTARLPAGRLAGRQPLRVVLDRSGRTPADARLQPALVLAEPPAQALAILAERGVVSVLLESGPTLAAAFVQAGLVDRVICYLAPALLGAGPSMVGPIGVGTISQALRLRLDEFTCTGEDVRLTFRRQ